MILILVDNIGVLRACKFLDVRIQSMHAGHNNSNLPHKKTQVFRREWEQFEQNCSHYCFRGIFNPERKILSYVGGLKISYICWKEKQ